MKFVFDDEQLALRDGVRALLTNQCTPDDVRASWDTETGRSPERWKALADLGVLGLTVPEEFGGLGLDDTWLVLLLEEAGRAALPEPLGPATVAIGLMLDVAPELYRAEWLPRIVAGNALAVAALPHTPWVDDAHTADLLLVAEDGQLHVVDPATAQIEPVPTLDRSRRRFEVTPRMTARSCLADRAGGAIDKAVDRAGLAEAAYLLGTAAKLIDLATSYAQEREQFGAPIGSFQAVKHQLASALVRTEFARPAVYRAAWSVAHDAAGRSDHVAMALTLAGQAAHLAARTSLQVHGAIGYTDEHDLHLWLRRGLNPAAALP